MHSEHEMELEGAYYPDIKAFATQGHPELGKYDDYTFWCFSKLEHLILGTYPTKAPNDLTRNTGPYIPDLEVEQLRVEVARTIG
jgi:hypothetical protein